jgi:hypothetical protein
MNAFGRITIKGLAMERVYGCSASKLKLTTKCRSCTLYTHKHATILDVKLQQICVVPEMCFVYCGCAKLDTESSILNWLNSIRNGTDRKDALFRVHQAHLLSTASPIGPSTRRAGAGRLGPNQLRKQSLVRLWHFGT